MRRIAGGARVCTSGRPPAVGARSSLLLPLFLLPLLVTPRGVAAQVFLTQEEALRVAFPEPTRVERHTAFLSEGQLERARELAGGGVDVSQSVVTYYVGVREGEPVGAAYFDAHRVRTLPEAVMIVVDTAGAIERIEILKFAEPPEYIAPSGWLEQFRSLTLSEELSLKRAVVKMTGATLTSRAITAASRRVLALHRVIAPFGDGGPPAGASAAEKSSAAGTVSARASGPGEALP